jgi:putative polyhydroxyalkanoate system protein
MSEIKITREHALGRDEARRRVNAMEVKLRDKYGVKLQWTGDSAEFKGTGVTGTLSVEENAVAVNLKLGLLMKPMAGKIREAMEHQLGKALV